MKARVRSGKQMLIRLFCVMAAVTLGCFAVLGVYSLSNTQEELAYCNEAALDVFCTSLEYAAEDLEAFNQSLFSSGVAFDLLGVQENVPVEQLLLSEMNLRQLSRNRTTANTGMGYPLTPETTIRIMLFRVPGFHTSETPLAKEKEFHRAVSDAMKQSELNLTTVHISARDHRGFFLVLLFSAEPERAALLSDGELTRLFDCLSKILKREVIQCCAGQRVLPSELRAEQHRLRDVLDGKTSADGSVLLLSSEEEAGSKAELISGRGARWRALLSSGQHKILLSEVEDCHRSIETMPAGRPKAYCDLHQRLTHTFFNYFYENGADVHNLFRSEYGYNQYMSSFSDPDDLRRAVLYMLR